MRKLLTSLAALCLIGTPQAEEQTTLPKSFSTASYPWTNPAASRTVLKSSDENPAFARGVNHWVNPAKLAHDAKVADDHLHEGTRAEQYILPRSPWEDPILLPRTVSPGE
jgi:hypothetical protein